MNEWISVLKYLPEHGQRVICFGHRTFCCELDMDEEAKEHEVIFEFNVSYFLKKEIPLDHSESILDECTVEENWNTQISENSESGHVLGVTKWKKI